MNINICKKCKLCPYFYDFSENGKKIICISRHFPRCLIKNYKLHKYKSLVVSHIDENTFQKIKKGINFNETFNKVISELEIIIRKNNYLKHIDINERCPYYVEHQLMGWNYEN